MKSIFLCAGFATRMYPLTKNKAKALLPIGGKPILSRIIEKFISDDVELGNTYIVTNEKFYRDFIDWKDESKYDLKIEIINDKSTDNSNRLGSIGDLNLVINEKNINEDLLVVAGDNLIAFDTKGFVTFSGEKRLTVACKDLKNSANLSLYGILQLDNENKITDFEEKPDKPKSSLIATGIYFFGKEHIKSIQEYVATAKSTDKSGDLIKWLSTKYAVYGYRIHGQWYDIGDTDVYNEVCEMFGAK